MHDFCVQDLKDIVRDEAGRTGNYLGDIVIDPERSDFLGKITFFQGNISSVQVWVYPEVSE